MHPQLLTTVPVLICAFLLMKDYWLIVAIAILGGVYPDIEKLAYLDLHLPKALVLFPWHSCFLSGRPWEYAHKDFLIVTEICLFVLMLAWDVVVHQTPAEQAKPLSFRRCRWIL